MVVNDLIRQAYFTAHVLREGEEAIGFKAVQGLQFLNAILDEWGGNGVFIPYTNQIFIDLIANQYLYQYSPVIVELTEAQLIIETNVQQSLYIANEYDFNRMNFQFPITRPNSIYLGKEQAFDQNGNLASNLYFYPTPQQSYTARLMIRQQLAEVTLLQSLDALPARIYKTLRYQLTNDIQLVYGTEMPPKFYNDLQQCIAQMQALNPTDMSVLTTDPFKGYRRFRPWGYGINSPGSM